MKVALKAGLRRETIHGRTFSEIVSMKITLRNRIQERNYTWKDFFGNRVYENRNQMLIFAVNYRLNIHDFRMRTSMSILPVDFRFQAGNPYTRFSKKASHVQSLLFGQGDVFILVWFLWDAYAERLFLFAHPIRLPLSIYISVPPHANKKIDNFFFACGCRAGILLDF